MKFIKFNNERRLYNKMKNIIIGLLVVLSLVLAGLSGFLANKPAEIKEIEVPFVVERLVEKNDTLVDEMATDYLENKYDEKIQNDTAKALVLEEIAGRDFKKAVFAILEENKSVEDYKDLTIYSVKIDEVTLNDDETAEVEVTFKVKGFESGDEEDEFKARLTATFVVEDLDVDEIDEADVSEYDIVLEKFYD